MEYSKLMYLEPEEKKGLKKMQENISRKRIQEFLMIFLACYRDLVMNILFYSTKLAVKKYSLVYKLNGVDYHVE